MPAEIIDESESETVLAPTPAGATRDGTLQRKTADRAPLKPLVPVAAAVMEVLLDAVGRSASEVVVLLAGDERIRELNRLWRGKDQPTDVLSFSQLEGEAVGGEEAELLGDIVVSVDTLRRQARDGDWSDEEELARLLLHGLLHLIGYDHERGADELLMKEQEGRLAGILLSRGLACAWEDSRR